MATRFVVCIDIDSDDLKEAYLLLYDQLVKTGVDWETTDENYNADGERIPECDMQAARTKKQGENDV